MPTYLGSAPVGDWPAGWADLPEGVLSLLASEHLPCVRDRHAMAAVCRPWRRSVPVSDLRASPLPCVLLPSRDSPPFLICLLGGAHRHPAPCILHEDLPRYISSADQRGWLLVATAGRGYRVFNFWSGELISLPSYVLDNFLGRLFVRICAASIAPLPPAPALSAHTPGVMVGAIMNGGARLGFWPIQSYKEKFYWAPGLEGGQFEDIIFFNSSFFVLTRDEGMVEFVPEQGLQGLRVLPAQQHLFCPRIAQPGLALPPEAVVARFLVDSGGELLMVLQIAANTMPGQARVTTGFQIYGARAPAFDGILHRWVGQELGGRLMFLGRGCSRSFDTSNLAMGMKPGFYFLDGGDFYEARPKSYACQDMGFCSPDGSIAWVLPRAENCPLSPAVWALPFPIPAVTRLGQHDKERLAGMAGRLQGRVVGQTHGVHLIAGALLSPRAGLGRSQQPAGSFLFLGPTGVGKTQLAKALAEQLFGDENLLMRIDMSQYMDKDSVGRLFGALPGLVGQLTETVRRSPCRVILIEELEQAHPEVLDKLLRLLEDGSLADDQGRMVNFRQAVVIIASNLGAHYLHAGIAGKYTMTMARDLVMREVKRHFRPELLNLLDEIVLFDPLSRDQLREVARLQIKDLAVQLAERGVALAVTDAALNFFVSVNYDPVSGAGPMCRWIEKMVLSQMQEIDQNSTLYIEASNKGELQYRVEKQE